MTERVAELIYPRLHNVKITTIIGARPQFIKAAALTGAFRDNQIHERVVHTGQHYDRNMSEVFFNELEMPEPAINLGVNSGSHGAQTGEMLASVENDLIENRPDALLVYGDTNSTLAGALAASKLHIPVVHVEAGLRSFDMAMPEEVNRVLTDHVSNLLLCPTKSAVKNLENENVRGSIRLVGDVMQVVLNDLVGISSKNSNVLSRSGIKKQGYYLATVHRAENTADADTLFSIMDTLGDLDRLVVLPMHPRTKNVLESWGWKNKSKTLKVIDPVGYIDMVALINNSAMVLTDSGGLQKEAGWLGKQCVTMRKSTEWVETVEAGINKVVGTSDTAIRQAIDEFKSSPGKFNMRECSRITGDIIGAIRTEIEVRS